MEMSKDIEQSEMSVSSLKFPPKDAEINVSELITICGPLGLRFFDPKDEKLYRKYICKQKNNFSFIMVLCLAFVTVTLVILDAVTLFVLNGHSKSTILDTNIYIRIGVFGFILFLSILAMCYFYSGKHFNENISVTIWCLFVFCIFFAIYFERIHTPVDGLPLILLLIFLTFFSLPTRLLFCCMMGGFICIGHVVIVSVFWTIEAQTIFVLGNQIGANILLCLGAGTLGAFSYLYFDCKHRTSFQDTRSSLMVKVKIDQGHLEQERLLLSVLPKHVADEMICDLGSMGDGQFRKIYMARHEEVSILFADIVGFTAISSSCTAEELVKILNKLFANFDKLSNKFKQSRIKILGDCYYCVCGAPDPRPDHAVWAIHMGLEMVEVIKDVATRTGKNVNMRVGIHTGAVLGGVLGLKQWQFDVLGKEVTIANKMESSGLPGRVHISHTTRSFLRDEFELEPGYGQDREEVLRINNISTFLVKRVLKPFKDIDENIEIVLQEDRKASQSSLLNKEQFNKKLEQTLLNRCDDHIYMDSSRRVSLHLSALNLVFNNTTVEDMYQRRQEPCRGVNMAGLCFTLALTFLAKMFVLPRSLLIFLVFFVGEILLVVLTIFTWPRPCGSKSSEVTEGTGRWVDWMNGSRYSRLFCSLLSVVVLFVSDTAGIFDCDIGPEYNVTGGHFEPNDSRCQNPEYFMHSTCLVLIATSCMLQFGFLMKSLMFLVVAVAVGTFNNLLFSTIFDYYDNNIYSVSPVELSSRYRLIVMLIMISVILIIISRYLDKTYRRLYFWKYQTTKQKEQVTELRKKNESLIYNILPDHVARDFIGQQKKDDELYSHSYSNISVMFASCPNFHDFYNESSVNNNGLECLRFLNEIISDYDELLEQTRFASVCKIKTVGSTYMAAGGMTSNVSKNSNIKEKCKHLDDLVQFAFVMKETLQKINEQSFNQFVLRIGINHGPVVAGVIGVRKPHYDIWGNTVNVASRMESTGHLSKIQVVEETKVILENFGYIFEKRGLVSVKGKGDLMTYFIKEPKQVALMPNQII